MSEDAAIGGTGEDRGEYETRSVQLIDHALQAMVNEHAAQGWELVDVDESYVATMRRPVEGATPWEYATVLIVPAARDAILQQWTAMGYELALERGKVAYLRRPRETAR